MQSIPSIWKRKTLICVCAWIHWFGPIFSCEITCERYEIGMLFRKGFLVLLFPSLHIPFHGTAWTSSFTRSISRNLKVSYMYTRTVSFDDLIHFSHYRSETVNAWCCIQPNSSRENVNQKPRQIGSWRSG